VDKVEAEFTIINALGLPARAGAQVVKVANPHACGVHAGCQGQAVRPLGCASSV